MTSEGRSYVTITELDDKLSAFRWEIRCYVLLVVLALLGLQVQIPHSITAFVRHLID